MLRRKMLTPAAINLPIISAESVAGTRVAMILVRRIRGRATELSDRLALQQLFSLLLQILQFGPQLFLGFFVHAIDEEDSLQMIKFVLDRAGEQATGAKLNFLSLRVGSSDLD